MFYEKIETFITKALFDRNSASARRPMLGSTIAIATLLFLSLGQSAVTAQPGTCGVTQITSSNLGFGSSGTAASAFSNNNGTRIVFDSDGNLTGGDPERNGEVYIYDSAQGFTQITNTTGFNFGGANATISGDGSKIVFMSPYDLTGGNPDGNWELFLYDVNTAVTTQITNTTGFADIGIGIISRDGNKVAFDSQQNLTGNNADGNYEVFVYDVATATFTQITNSVSKNSFLWSISGDGSRVSLVSNADLVPNFNLDGNYEIFVHDAATGFIQVTVTAGASVFNTGNFMSDDGLHVVFQSNYQFIGNPDGNMEIYLFDLANSALTQVTNTTGTGNYPGGINGDGSRVVFFSNRNLTGSNPDGNSEVFLYDRTNGSITQVSNTLPPAANYRAEISFDGTRIFWDSDGYPAGNADGNREIFMAECVPPPSADVSVSIGVDNQNPKQGDKITYTVTVKNFGPNAAQSVVLNDLLSSSSTFVNAQANKGTLTTPAPGQSGTVTWNIGSLANNSQESAQIKVTVTLRGKGTITNTASVNSTTSDPNTSNNSASLTVSVGAGGKK